MILSVRDRPFGGFKSVNDYFHKIILCCFVEWNEYPSLISYQFVANRAYRPFTPEWELMCFNLPLRDAIFVEYNFSAPEIFFESFNILKDRKGYHVRSQGFSEFYKLGKTLKILYQIFPCVPQES